MASAAKIGVVIPSYKVSKHILDVLKEIGPEVSKIYVVDDACPEGSGKLVESKAKDKRIKVIYNPENRGVGGAMIAGYEQALADNMEIIVKIDGDGQMDPKFIKTMVAPIIRGEADYTKGNRFDSIDALGGMPAIRVFGNAVLSFMAKVSTGYWNVTDPNNGYTAVHADMLRSFNIHKLHPRYFFESDMLFRMCVLRAVVYDIPMKARYADEKSNLSITKTMLEFPYRHTVNFLKRIFYSYYLREMSAASFELPAGVILFIFGISSGLTSWAQASAAGRAATTGSVMIAAVALIVGFQLVLAFISQDVASVPKRVRHNREI